MGLFLHFQDISCGSKTTVAPSRAPRHHHSRMLATIHPAIRAIMLLAVCGVLMSAAVRAEESIPPSRTELGKADWSVNASRNLATYPTSYEKVAEFLRAIEISVNGESCLPEYCQISSFAFADLRRDGTLSLVYGLGVGDRSRFDVDIVDKTAAGFEIHGSSGARGAGNNIPASIRDIGHDGRLEFVLDSGLGTIEQRCTANWMAIFAWTGANYTNVSHQYKDFYRQQLEATNKIIAGLPQAQPGDDHTMREKECLLAEAAALRQFLGGSPKTGMDQAIRLAKSPDHFEREFAVELLNRTGGPTARKYLEILAKDPDHGVALYAKSSLKGSLTQRVYDGPSEFQLDGRAP